MSTDTAFQTLWTALHALRDNLGALALTVSQDHPAVRAVPQPVRRASEDVDDLRGALHEAIAAIAPGLTVRALHDCHARLIAMGRDASTGIASTERLDDLATVARDRDVRWRRWHASVVDGVERGERALWDCHLATLTCWDELSSSQQVVTCPASRTEED